ncbi:MAG: hypothetical protein GY702_09420 [Desulfobulbaceae bacterium]|nr:hypothetical protein [Desulfobulbaceae bacterium]
MKSVCRLWVLIVAAIVLASCSSSDEDSSKNKIEETTDAVAQKAIESIKQPIEQAKHARELVEQHNKKLQEASKQQQ